MDFNKTRCPFCFKYFCCSAHRVDHQVKHHSRTLNNKQQNYLATVFNKKSKAILPKPQIYQETKNMKSSDNTKVPSCNTNLPAFKRLHCEMNKRILSSATVVSSQTRKILVPVHRLKLYKTLKDDSGDANVSKETKVVSKESPYDDNAVKTSTPINNSFPNQTSSQMMWNVSSESSISHYQTPSGSFPGHETDDQSNTLPTKRQMVATPLRGIISKVSKYDSDSDSGPSPASNSSRSRRVTFSFSSQVSSTSSPLESIREVEICEEIENTHFCFEEINLKAMSSCAKTSESLDKLNNIKKLFEDSVFSTRERVGFLSCVTNIFCSAVHSIPSLPSWRKTESDVHFLNRSKRLRSPEKRKADFLDIESPLLKRPCYPIDLRKNPIKSRRAISRK